MFDKNTCNELKMAIEGMKHFKNYRDLLSRHYLDIFLTTEIT